MTNKIASTAGFRNGKFVKAGQGYIEADFEKMSKDELIVEAEARGIEVKASDTKAEIIAALSA